MRGSSNVFLVGPMGAGKSTIGRLLSQQLRMEFKDSDREIELRCGADIPWIFDVEGEEGFRERETAALDELSCESGLVLATGGGIVMREQNRRLLAERGVVVYLSAAVDQLVERTSKDRRRPLLQVDNPREVLERLMKVRDPLYREIADVIVVTDHRPPRLVVSDIVEHIKPFLSYSV